MKKLFVLVGSILSVFILCLCFFSHTVFAGADHISVMRVDFYDALHNKCDFVTNDVKYVKTTFDVNDNTDKLKILLVVKYTESNSIVAIKQYDALPLENEAEFEIDSELPLEKLSFELMYLNPSNLMPLSKKQAFLSGNRGSNVFYENYSDSLIIDADSINFSSSNLTDSSSNYTLCYSQQGNNSSIISLSSDYTFVVNGDTYTNDNSNTILNDLKDFSVCNFVLNDLNKDGLYDIIGCTAYKQVMVDTVNETTGVIRTLNSLTTGIKLDINNIFSSASLRDIKGNIFDFKNIQKYDVLAVAVSPYDSRISTSMDYNYIDIVVIGQNVVNGTIKSINTLENPGFFSSGNSIEIDSDLYEISNEFDVYYEKTPEMGLSGDFYIGINGKIVGFDHRYYFEDNYGFIVCASDSDTSPSSMTILEKNGEIKTFNYADTIQIINPVTDETANISPDDNVSDFYSVFNKTSWIDNIAGMNFSSTMASMFASSDQFKDTARMRIIKYDVDLSGNISLLMPLPSARYTSVDFTSATVSAAEYNSQSNILGDTVLDENFVMFNIDWDNISNSSVKDKSFFNEDNQYYGIMIDDNKAMVLLSYNPIPNPENVIAIVTSSNKTTDSNGNDAKLLTVYAGEEEKNLLITNETQELYTNTCNDLSYGFIILYSSDRAGNVSKFSSVGSVAYDEYNRNPEFKFNEDFAENAANLGVNSSDNSEGDAYYLGVLNNIGLSIIELDIVRMVSSYNDSTIYLTGKKYANEYTFFTYNDEKKIDVGSSFGIIAEAEKDENYLVFARVTDDVLSDIIAFDRIYTDDEIADLKSK